MKGMKRKKGMGKKLAVCVAAGILSVFLMTGCEEQGEESTVAKAEISTTMENKEDEKLSLVNLKVYQNMENEEKKEVLELYLTELYKLEETQLPEGEEYEEVILALEAAVESVLKNNPDKTLQDLLEEAENLQKDQEGISIEEFFAANMDEDLTK